METMNRKTEAAEPEVNRCPVCGEPTEKAYPEEVRLHFPNLGRTHFRRCACVRAREEAEEKARRQREHEETVRHLLEECFPGSPSMRQMTFEASAHNSPAAEECRKYADRWEKLRAENIGMLLWGDVGTGKTYMAACIANALISREIPVRMLNLGEVMNAPFETKEAMMKQVKHCELLILDDFGMERETEYGLEAAFSVIDARCRSNKPLIVTTNLSLKTIKNPTDTAHRRIYDRILEMCTPIRFSGPSLRESIRLKKMNRFSEIVNG